MRPSAAPQFPGGIESPARTLLRGLVGPVDPRTPEELEQDLADEIAFHLSAIEDEERTAGLDVDAARVEARRRFGDPDRIRAQCRRIALEEQSMIQRLNAVLIVCLLAAVVAIGVHGFLSQRSTSRTLGELAQSVDRLAAIQSAGTASAAGSLDADSLADRSNEAADSSQAAPVVYLAGRSWTNAGAHPLPPGRGMVLRRLMLASGGFPQRPDEYIVTVDRPEPAEGRSTRLVSARWWSDDVDDPDGFPDLRAGDVVELARTPITSVDLYSRSLRSGSTMAGLRSATVSYPSVAPQSLKEVLESVPLSPLPGPLGDLKGLRAIASISLPTEDGSHSTREVSWLVNEEPPPDVTIPRGASIVMAYELPAEPPPVDEWRLTEPFGPPHLTGRSGAGLMMSILARSVDSGVQSEPVRAQLLEALQSLGRQTGAIVGEWPSGVPRTWSSPVRMKPAE